MRRLAKVTALCVGVLLVGGCAFQAPVVPPAGGLYTSYSAPLTTELHGQGTATRTGEASTQAVLGLVAWGDCSLDAAAEEGGLSTIEYCDYSYLNVVLGVYQKFTVTAHGR